MDRRSFLAAAAALAGSTQHPPRSRPTAASPSATSRSARPIYGPEFYDDKELAQLRDVLEKRQPFRWYGPGSQPPMKVLDLREGAGRADADEVRAGGHLGHRRAHHRAGGPGRRAGRRGDPAGLELVLLLQLDRHERRPAGLRRVGRIVQPRSRPTSSRRSRRRPRRSWSSTRWATRPTWTPSWPSPAGAASRCWKTAPEPGRQLQGQAAGLDRRHRHLQLPDRQDDQLGRRRRPGHERPAPVRAGRAVSRPGVAPPAAPGDARQCRAPGDDRQPVPHERVHRRPCSWPSSASSTRSSPPCGAMPGACTRGSPTCPACSLRHRPDPDGDIGSDRLARASLRETSATGSSRPWVPRTCRRVPAGGRPRAAPADAPSRS